MVFVSRAAGILTPGHAPEQLADGQQVRAGEQHAHDHAQAYRRGQVRPVEQREWLDQGAQAGLGHAERQGQLRRQVDRAVQHDRFLDFFGRAQLKQRLPLRVGQPQRGVCWHRGGKERLFQLARLHDHAENRAFLHRAIQRQQAGLGRLTADAHVSERQQRESLGEVRALLLKLRGAQVAGQIQPEERAGLLGEVQRGDGGAIAGKQKEAIAADVEQGELLGEHLLQLGQVVVVARGEVLLRQQAKLHVTLPVVERDRQHGQRAQLPFQERGAAVERVLLLLQAGFAHARRGAPHDRHDAQHDGREQQQVGRKVYLEKLKPGIHAAQPLGQPVRRFHAASPP